MTVLRVVLLISLMAFTVTGQQKSVPPASCPVTVKPAILFIPPAPYQLDDNDHGFWIGTDKLFTALPKSGQVWITGPREPGHEHEVQPLTAKIFWASVDFNWRTEWPVQLKVTGRRLDGTAPPLLAMRSTNAMVGGPNGAMLSGVYVPTPGCWEITGDYKGEKLSFVVWVRPMDHDKK
ncbi:MAG TPA: hypothetical protein VJV03_13570 [Pyrinomonadaceae bacterium]|nr:hypothetical protein [Pyrinomonadaceae bacterium]